VQGWQVELLAGQRLELKPSVTLRQKGPGLKARIIKRATREAARRPGRAAEVELLV
jgi:hypothetical protein